MSVKSKNLIILMGNIGSGKSTFSRKYQKKGYVITAKDQLRYAIGGGRYVFNYDYEPVIHKVDLYLFKRFIDLNVNVLVDETNVSKANRKRYITYAKKRGYKITVIELPRFSVSESVTRRMTNPHEQDDWNLWNQVWTSFDKRYEAPNKNEGIDKIIKVKKNEVT